ncbi:biotin transporter BioY [Actinoplanes derwentensis]|uniref:Biotin transporter n=1 Tax=Actinoplanes derwentensis TaxID=113562 RepID=A0A1H1VXP1_9ACTN|nr:biotin transporter BioY [Actinoplanes derwentensis]GID83983.1 biotin biosynthesis protein BioY [Actinoplanes derwentensis]SDS89637.1 biotin transport system substrate-specific component [Actinoplanes derwentensis]
MNNLTLHAPRYVLGDLILTRLSPYTRSVLLVLGGAVLIGVSAQIAVPVPGSPVPVTGQTLAVLLTAAVLGPWRGPAACLTYVLAGLAGVSWFAAPKAVTFGYLLGMLLASVVVGELARRGATRTPWRVAPTMILGSLLVYAVGAPWMALSLGLDAATAVHTGVLPFLVGDALKVLIATAVLALLPRPAR